MKKNKDIDNYIKNLKEDSDKKLAEHVRRIIFELAPVDCEERLSYQLCGYYFNGPLIYFGIAKHHLGIYPTAEGIDEALKQNILKNYSFSKGTVRIPKDDDGLDAFVKEILKIRIEQKMLQN
ncbi:iron chaperone [Companilactobacillus sp. DQM5]|uniref:iron chaperone n=1 Tax=Companilactobacillus sp. DQM5 TaxID=3463359 RepID=UPI0040597097